MNDTHPKIEQMQIELLRQAGSERRAALTRSLSHSAIRLSKRAIKEANPQLSERELGLRFVALCYGEALARKLAVYLDGR